MICGVGAGDEFLLTRNPHATIRVIGEMTGHSSHVAACTGLGERKGRLFGAAGQVGNQLGFERLTAARHNGPRGQVCPGDQRGRGGAHAAQLFNDAHPQGHAGLAAAIGTRKRSGNDPFPAQKVEGVPGKHVAFSHGSRLRTNVIGHQLLHFAQHHQFGLFQVDQGVLQRLKGHGKLPHVMGHANPREGHGAPDVPQTRYGVTRLLRSDYRSDQ